MRLHAVWGSVRRGVAIGMAAAAVSTLALAPATAQQRDCRKPATKIIGGSFAKLGDWPGLAVIRGISPAGGVTSYFCGGSLISDRWILTAAHCLTRFTDEAQGMREAAADGEKIQVVLETDDLLNVPEQHVVDVKRFIVHEQFMKDFVDIRSTLPARDARFVSVVTNITATKRGNDIALIELEQPWFGRPATLSLDPSSDPAEKQQLRVAGFGAVSVNDWGQGQQQFFAEQRIQAGSEILKDVGIFAVATRGCNAIYDDLYGDMAIADGQLCAGIPSGPEAGSCQGDSGGPLVAFDEFACPVQVGLVSWADGCGKANRPTVYTRISAYKDWIESFTGSAVEHGPLVMESSTVATERMVSELENHLRGVLGEDADANLAVTISDGRNRFKLGEEVKIEVTPGVPGRLILIDINAAGETTVIYPNAFVAAREVPVLAPLQPVTIPGPGYGFDAFQAQPPKGVNKLIAIIAPESFDLSKVEDLQVDRERGFAPIIKPAHAFGDLAGLIESAVENPADWGLQVIDYLIY